MELLKLYEWQIKVGQKRPDGTVAKETVRTIRRRCQSLGEAKNLCEREIHAFRQTNTCEIVVDVKEVP
jgi:hypothetical protein